MINQVSILLSMGHSLLKNYLKQKASNNLLNVIKIIFHHLDYILELLIR